MEIPRIWCGRSMFRSVFFLTDPKVPVCNPGQFINPPITDFLRPVRKWGPGPYPVAVIHGGPGAPSEVAPVARELSAVCGVLEPFQTERTLDGQVQELHADLQEHSRAPVILVGFSYGALLSWIVAARYPRLSAG